MPIADTTSAHSTDKGVRIPNTHTIQSLDSKALITMSSIDIEGTDSVYEESRMPDFETLADRVRKNGGRRNSLS